MHQYRNPRTMSPPLVCVSGMLQVATSPQHRCLSPYQSSQQSHSRETPPAHSRTGHLRHLPSPSTSTVQTQRSNYQAHCPLPGPIINHQITRSTPAQPAAPLAQLLSQKQIRELRRLCRKTANRAQFEQRNIQLRQVASIAAMALHSQHLFDPTNTASGAPLRRWVDRHRATGADWRDERPLDQAALDELRNWDRLLKCWARLRFDCPTRPVLSSINSINPMTPQLSLRSSTSPSLSPRSIPRNILVPRSRQLDTVAANLPTGHRDLVRPVHLSFERLAVSTSPSRSPSTFVPPSLSASDVPPTSRARPLQLPIHPQFSSAQSFPALPIEVNSACEQSNMSHCNMHTPRRISPSLSPLTPMSAAEPKAWAKIPLPGLSRRVDSRRPMGDIPVNSLSDRASVQVSSAVNAAAHKLLDGFGIARGTTCDQENILPLPTTSLHASATAKSWRNALVGNERCVGSTGCSEDGSGFLSSREERAGVAASPVTLRSGVLLPKEYEDVACQRYVRGTAIDGVHTEHKSDKLSALRLSGEDNREISGIELRSEGGEQRLGNWSSSARSPSGHTF